MYWLTGVLGLAMAIAPFIMGYRDNSAAMWSSVILGIVVVLASLFEAYDEENAKWEYWIAGVAGIAAVVAPFVLGFTLLTYALWTTVALGAIIFLLSGYEVFFHQPTR